MLAFLNKLVHHVPPFVGFLGVLGGLVFAIVFVLNVLFPCLFKDCPNPIPVVESVSSGEVSPGQEVGVSGEHLDLVEEVQLRKGLVVERLFMLPLSETGMLLAVPSGVAPEKYILETRTRGKEEFVSTKQTLVVKPAIGVEDTTIIFANLNWDSARMQNAIARFIIEKGYGYPTDSFPDVPGQAEDVWKSLLTGSAQVYMEIWLPNSQKEWEQALESGSVIPLGKSLDLNWQSAFVVPTYMVEGNPGSDNAPAPDLRTVQDIRDYVHLFERPGSNGKSVLWSCLAIWNCADINEKQVEAYGLDDVIELRNPRSDEELFNKLRLAYEDKLPWLGYMWGPTKASSDLDLTRLEEPTCEVRQSPQDGCGYEPSRVRIVAHPTLVSKAPEIVELLRKWDFKTSTLFAAEECLEDTKTDFQTAAICYLMDQQAVWSQWMPPDVAQKVRDALRKE